MLRDTLVGFISKIFLISLILGLRSRLGGRFPYEFHSNLSVLRSSLAHYTHSRVQELYRNPQRAKQRAITIYQLAWNWGRMVRFSLSLFKFKRGWPFFYYIIRAVYTFLGIAIESVQPGELIVRECYFKNIYDLRTCRFMGYMDRGLMDGLLGNGHFKFSRRFTDPSPGCQIIQCNRTPRNKKRFAGISAYRMAAGQTEHEVVES